MYLGFFNTAPNLQYNAQQIFLWTEDLRVQDACMFKCLQAGSEVLQRNRRGQILQVLQGALLQASNTYHSIRNTATSSKVPTLIHWNFRCGVRWFRVQGLVVVIAYCVLYLVCVSLGHPFLVQVNLVSCIEAASGSWPSEIITSLFFSFLIFASREQTQGGTTQPWRAGRRSAKGDPRRSGFRGFSSRKARDSIF